MAVAATACLAALGLVYTGFAQCYRRLICPVRARRQRPAQPLERSEVLTIR